MNRLTRYLDERFAYMSKGKLWVSFIVWLVNGSVWMLETLWRMLGKGTGHSFSFWLGVALAPFFLLFAGLDAC